MKNIGQLKKMAPIKVHGVPCTGEYNADKLQMSTKPPKRQGKSGPGKALVDGPFGGKVTA